MSLPASLPQMLLDVYRSNRTTVREIKLSEYESFMRFLDRDDQDFPKTIYGWSHEAGSYTAWSANDAQERIRSNNDFYTNVLKGKNYFIFRKGTNEIIGNILTQYDRDRNCRISYYVSPSERNKGYAAEAHVAVIRDIKKRFPYLPIIAEVLPENKASQNVLLKNGFRLASGSGCVMSRHIGAVAAQPDLRWRVFVSEYMPS